MLLANPALAATAPPWLHALANLPLPAHRDAADAIELYSETVLSVDKSGKITEFDRKAFKILRPEGAARGRVALVFDSQTRIQDMRAWSIPTGGKDYALSEGDAVEASLDVPLGTLVSDVHVKSLVVPASLPGSVVGFETRQEKRPYVLQDRWIFQDTVPVHEARYRLELPPGWSYAARWINHPEEPPTEVAPGQFQWVIADVEPIVVEKRMPPSSSVIGGLVIYLIPPGGKSGGLQTWSELGSWYAKLAEGQRDDSAQLDAKVAELTATAPDTLAKIKALAAFAQDDIRYVAVELGIGGYRPHAATETLAHGYGDCKDKATLLGAMLARIGVASYPVIINTQRDVVTETMPPSLAFNHAILAIALPPDTNAADLPARAIHPAIGPLLYFDPTDFLTPFGRLRGALQANYGLLISPQGGELVRLPQIPARLNGLNRTARMSLDADGRLRGDVHEILVGDRAGAERYALRSARLDTDQIRPVERRVAASLTDFRVTQASVSNLRILDRPFAWNYSLDASGYARAAGELLLVRPRVLGVMASELLDVETERKRRYPIEVSEPVRDTDDFEITLPSGYRVDELPPPTHAETSFASYDSKTETDGRVLHFTRVFEIRNLSIPAAQAEELKELYRAISRDERATAVLKRVAPAG